MTLSVQTVRVVILRSVATKDLFSLWVPGGAFANHARELLLAATFDTIPRFACQGRNDLGPAAKNRRIP